MLIFVWITIEIAFNLNSNSTKKKWLINKLICKNVKFRVHLCKCVMWIANWLHKLICWAGIIQTRKYVRKRDRDGFYRNPLSIFPELVPYLCSNDHKKTASNGKIGLRIFHPVFFVHLLYSIWMDGCGYGQKLQRDAWWNGHNLCICNHSVNEFERKLL